MQRTSQSTRAHERARHPAPPIRVRDVMRKHPPTIASDTRLPVVEQRFQQDGVRQLLVLDRGTVVGIITPRDLGAAHGSCVPVVHVEHLGSPSTLTAADVMSRPVVTVGTTATLVAAARMMMGSIPARTPSAVLLVSRAFR